MVVRVFELNGYAGLTSVYVSVPLIPQLLDEPEKYFMPDSKLRLSGNQLVLFGATQFPGLRSASESRSGRYSGGVGTRASGELPLLPTPNGGSQPLSGSKPFGSLGGSSWLDGLHLGQGMPAPPQRQACGPAKG